MGVNRSTILNKRAGYAKAFDDWEIEKIAKYDEDKFDELMQNAAIVRNKLKIRATIANAIATLRVQKEFGSFSNYLWAFIPDNRPILNNFNAMSDLPSKTDLSSERLCFFAH